VRGSHKRRSKRLPLTLTLSPCRKRHGERGQARDTLLSWLRCILGTYAGLGGDPSPDG